jgi:SAM-dependent methyltransferase
MLKAGVQVVQKGDLFFLVERDGKVKRFKPWLGDMASFLYDPIMARSIFPKKLGADMNRHHEILREELSSIQQARVLELAAGSGAAVHFLDPANAYVGTDISPGLLRRAAKRFRNAGFDDIQLYVAEAEDLPFADECRDCCLCILSLNFFSDADRVFGEVRRVLVAGGRLVCATPVPERNERGSLIRGTLRTEIEIEELCRKHGLDFQSLPARNGALLYFRAMAG